MMRKMLLWALCLVHYSAWCQMRSTQLDSLVPQVLRAFDVPGIAVGIVHQGKVIHAKGYGVRSLKSNLPVDENTLFGIASNSKAFTGVALAMLVDEKKLHWDDKVTQYIPEFTLYDKWVGAQFTIKDLLTHRSGLGLGAGDLMFFPEGGNHDINSVLQGLSKLKPVSSFRTKYDYNNNFYIVAGEVIKRVSGLSWEDFIEQRIMKPVGMTMSYASYHRVKNKTNIIDAHAPVNGKAIPVPHDWNELANPAGGIMSNLTDLSKWAMVVMNNFELPQGGRLISQEQQQQLWNIQMPMPVALGGPYNTHFSGYGLGWVLSDVKGQFQVAHTGGLIGTVTQFTLLPDMKLGIIVLTNQQQGVAFATITNTIKDSYLDYPDRNWLRTYTGRYEQFNKEAAHITDSVYRVVAKQNMTPIMEQEILGTYEDAWMGRMKIFKTGKLIRIRFERSPNLVGTVLPLAKDVYVAKWDARYYDADAYLKFVTDPTTGKASGLTMEAISPATDFSFDVQDLALTRVE